VVGFLRIPLPNTMLLLDNLRFRFREWKDQPVDPDLVPRFRRLWRAKVEAPVPSGPPPAALPARFLLATAHTARARRAS